MYYFFEFLKIQILNEFFGFAALFRHFVGNLRSATRYASERSLMGIIRSVYHSVSFCFIHCPPPRPWGNGEPGNTVLRVGGRGRQSAVPTGGGRQTAESRPYRRGTADGWEPSLQAGDGGRLRAVPTGRGRRTTGSRPYRRGTADG